MSSGEWALVVLGGIVAPFVAAALVGCLISRSHRSSRSVTLQQAPATIWEAISNLDRLPSWWMMLRSVEKLPKQDGKPRFRQTFANRRGKDNALELEVVESKAPERFVTRIADENAPFQGRWTYDIVPGDGGTRVTVTEDGSIGNPLMRFFFRTMMSKTFYVDSYLRALGQKFGEKVEPK